MSVEIPRRNPVRIGSLLALVAAGMTLAGCSPFDKPQSLTQTANKLPAIKPPPGSMQLDMAYIEWPADDPQLGQQLWRHVDEVGPVDTETRMRLRQSGFRVGVVGTNPPVALQRMLGLTSDFASEPDAEEMKRFSGTRSVFLVSGNETEVQVSNAYAECEVAVPVAGLVGSHGESRVELRRFENAVCKYRVRAFRIQDGWARLEFTPQINHGDDQLRHGVGDQMQWEYQSGQLTESFRAQRFSIELKTGDMAIITAADDSARTLGELFYHGPAALRRPRDPEDENSPDENQSEQPAPPEAEYPIQRLLLVRLAGMDCLEPVLARGR